MRLRIEGADALTHRESVQKYLITKKKVYSINSKDINPCVLPVQPLYLFDDPIIIHHGSANAVQGYEKDIKQIS